MYKVNTKDLIEITNLLDVIHKLELDNNFCKQIKMLSIQKKAKKISEKIKQKYTDIKY